MNLENIYNRLTNLNKKTSQDEYSRYGKWLEEIEEVQKSQKKEERVMELIDVISTSLSYIQVLMPHLDENDILKLLDIKVYKWEQEVDRKNEIQDILAEKKEDTKISKGTKVRIGIPHDPYNPCDCNEFLLDPVD